MGYYKTVTKWVNQTKTRTVTKDLGYDLIPICRPNFIFFEFVGLRPNTPHWLFFDGVDVTKWVNTSYSISDYNTADRNSKLRNPGDAFIKSTAFPNSLGGPTAASGPLTSDAVGTIEGVFYLQSNSSISFPTGKRTLMAIDISVPDKKRSLSYATATYSAIGEYDIYTQYQETYTERKKVTERVYVPTENNNGGNPNNNTANAISGNNKSPDPVFSYKVGNTYYNRYSWDDVTDKDVERTRGAEAARAANEGKFFGGGR